jgi:epoxyqueuosine reductase
VPDPFSSNILTRCRDLGFALAGIAPAEPTRYADELRAWLGAGKHGEMHYLARHMPQRLDPRRLLDGARSIICVADRYHDGQADSSGRPGSRGRIARYARGDDYHVVMKKRLHRLADELTREYPAETFRACVDTAPVLEREIAQRAGLGAVGKHTLLIEPGNGSWLFLGELITTLQLTPSEPCEEDPCGTCTRCIDACPTGAIAPWTVDATRCISYLTIEHRSEIDQHLSEAMGDWIFGCDVCQEVCPHNQPTERSRVADVHPAYVERHADFDLLEVLGWNAQARREALQRSAMKRAKLAMMKRNAVVIAANMLAKQDAPDLRSRIEAIAEDPNEEQMVRATARGALRRRRD